MRHNAIHAFWSNFRYLQKYKVSTMVLKLKGIENVILFLKSVFFSLQKWLPHLLLEEQGKIFRIEQKKNYFKGILVNRPSPTGRGGSFEITKMQY